MLASTNTSCSSATRRGATPRLPRRFLDRSTVIPNTVGRKTGDRRAARARLGIPDDAMVLLNVGICPSRRTSGFDHRETDIPDAMLVIAGDGGSSPTSLQPSRTPRGERVRLWARCRSKRSPNLRHCRFLRLPVALRRRPLALIEAATAGLHILHRRSPRTSKWSAPPPLHRGDDLEGWIDAMQRSVKDREFSRATHRTNATAGVGSDDVTISST